ncbi:hypothetical protein NIES37_56730 [Tolypothrix tenuis PCC 7101]|uniref:Uncharacterized protein n=1 Tax=Tolypothrix tenuis PCC 7101 TaxID=231146 RepID=A0A1Z4N7F3_9CYAN|nr:hypothetical protein [Aulosira sp. FACHB-113]BAZ01669.1 hypothetical protein NIES37_56730 [Tolypothrix tenuis PCC 7101]BAZ74406.1 hypothetical protein NIES50_29800 [Aulosira laxa NIES-50]
MTSFESNKIKTVEVDNVTFETVVSDRVLTIPEVKRGVYTLVRLGIRIINNRQTPLYFPSHAYSMFPEMIAPDDQLMLTDLHSERLSKRIESDYVLVIPGEAVTFSRDSFLFWIQNRKKKRERKLALNIPFPSEDIYIFRPLYPGIYQFRFKYNESHESIKDFYQWNESTKLNNIWTGKVLTPLVEIHLVEP